MLLLDSAVIVVLISILSMILGVSPIRVIGVYFNFILLVIVGFFLGIGMHLFQLALLL